MMMTRMSVSILSFSKRFCINSTPRTTAVLEPAMTPPRQILWMESNPSSVPTTVPPRTMNGTSTIATFMANIPCLRIFFRLISIPMTNISRINPMSDSMLTTVSESSLISMVLAMMIPAIRYPIRGGSLILLKTMEQTAASSKNIARLVSSVISSILSPKI